MRRFFTLGIAAALAAASGGAQALRADDEPADASTKPNAEAPANLDLDELVRARGGGGPGGPSAPDKKYRDFNEVTQGAQKIDGFLTLHLKDDHLYAEIRPQQFDQPMLAPITIARGLAEAGVPLTRDDEMVLVFHKVGDRVQLIRRDVKHKAPAGTPIEKAVKQNYTDSVLLALPIVSVNPAGGMSTVVDLSDIFLTDFAQLGLGFLDRSRSSYAKVKGFKDNVEIQVEATFGGGRVGGDTVPDPRGVTVVLHYSLMKLPDPGYRVRNADDRVGHFLSTTKDFGQAGDESPYVRMVNRWRLEKADPRAKLSPPKKQIIFYVEDNVPYEYRPYVEAGIREWNKAFEKIGFLEAITVRWQQPGEEFDPEDANYCTFRWITTNRTYAMSCLRANPLTGELIDGDVIFDASWIRAWKQQYAFLTAGPWPTAQGEAAGPIEPIAVGEVISPILAAKRGFGLPTPLRRQTAQGGELTLVPAEWDPIQARISQRLGNQAAFCQFSGGMQMEMGLALLALADEEKKEGVDPKLPEDLLGQAIKEVTMHEVGHSLGLRHNFKASTMLSPDQLNDTSITRTKGNTASVMDYTPINIAPKGQKQGDYFSPTIGPYDYWAIEYAYRPIDGNEGEELKKIAARAPEADLVFATDEDMYGNNDPLVNTYDIGNDVCKFAKDRMALATELLKDIDSKSVKDGESWLRNRQAFSYLLAQYGNASALLAAYVGGQQVHRDHKGDKDARDPIVPIPGAKQREALAVLVDQVLADKAFTFSPATLRRLGVEKWSDWSSNGGSGVEFPVYDRVLAIQRIALSHCLSGDVLSRVQNQELQSDPDSKPLKVAEIFRALTDGIWSELNDASADASDKTLAVSTIRRNLQREHLKRLSGMVLGDASPNLGDGFAFVAFDGAGGAPADARALARMHLKEVRDKIGKALERNGASIDDATRAHLEECRDKIGKVLDAGLDANGF
jgi:hypothetical protein